jgi:hypothetical protein
VITGYERFFSAGLALKLVDLDRPRCVFISGSAR